MKGSVTATKARLEVLHALPDSFPFVDLVFRAVDSLGTPYWDLRREQLSVSEDGRECEVTCLTAITYPKPIDISLVVDHSGSMGVQAILEQDTALYLRFLLDSTGYKLFLDTATTPLIHAKAGVLDFIRSFDLGKDRIAVTGFAGSVEEGLPLSSDTAAMAALVRGFTATTSTALYDAVVAGLRQLENANGLRVMVVLTDGLDNASVTQLHQAVDVARAANVPIYAIGLGNASRPVLDSLAMLSGGKAYFTADARALSRIYSDISKEIQAYYELTYRSENLASLDTTRDAALTIDFGGSSLAASVSVQLPEEVVAWLAQKERERTWLWAGGALVALAASAAIVYRFRRKKQPMLESLWPVPAEAEIYLRFSVPAVSVQFNQAAQGFAKNMRGTSGVNRYDISNWPSGAFVVTVIAAGREPEVHRFIKL